MNILEQYSDTSKILSEMNLQQGSYISLLKGIEKILPTLLKKSDSWNTVDINYSPPMVNRVWLEYGALRICLHRIYPANPSETLFHPHPWPSSMKILKGTYEMA